MRRAVATAAPIGLACGLSPIIVPRLHERAIGPLSGLSRETGWEIYVESKRRWMSGDLEFTHPGGESFADIRRRSSPCSKSFGLAIRERRLSWSHTAS